MSLRRIARRFGSALLTHATRQYALYALFAQKRAVGQLNEAVSRANFAAGGGAGAVAAAKRFSKRRALRDAARAVVAARKE